MILLYWIYYIHSEFCENAGFGVVLLDEQSTETSFEKNVMFSVEILSSQKPF